jgi:hypothetical protein
MLVLNLTLDSQVTAMSASESVLGGWSPGSMSAVKFAGRMTGYGMSIEEKTEYSVDLGT